jgi:acyl-CoA synthetase (AMP-forming)/AMP-acid ligase II
LTDPTVPLGHLTWRGADDLPADVRTALLGPSAPFRLVTEPVLGHDHLVFAERPHTLRRARDQYAAGHLDLVCLTSDRRSWTFGEAAAQIDAMAVLLAERYGVRTGDRVAIVAANSAEYALLMWATVTLGAIVTSLNGWWTGPEMRHGIQLAAPILIVGDSRRLARLDDAPEPGQVPVRLLSDLYDEAQEFLGREPAAPDITEDSPAVILFTSGTTGRPKGATVSHRNIINFGMINLLSGAIAAATGPSPAAGPPPRSAVILTSPMFHISGLVAVFVSGVFARAKLIFAPPGAWDPERYLALTAEHRATVWSGVPTQLWRILRHPTLGDHDLSSVTNVSSGGAVLPPQLMRELHARFPNVRLGSGYGMSETVGVGTIIGGDLIVRVPESTGAPQPTVEVQVRDGLGHPLPEGEVGEIHLRTPSVFLGYWQDPEASANVLDSDRWYATGDYGRISNGLLFLESRRRDLILRGGENIYPIEIENRLVEHPEIVEAAVIGVDHPELGQEVKAFIVRSPGSTLDAAAVSAWCAQVLAKYKLPSDIEFTTQLPYNATGKLVKHELERLEQERRRAAAAVVTEQAAAR